MKIIAIEGLDKAGKHTQADLLAENLTKMGYKVARYEFVDYDSVTGKLIQEFLHHEQKLDPFTVQLLQAANKQELQPKFKSMNDEYDFLILDRYVQSQFVYGAYFILKQARKGHISPEEFSAQLNILDILSRDTIVKPWLNLYIDVDVEHSIGRKGEHGANDDYERNKKLLEFTRKLYTDCAMSRKDTLMINGMQTPDEVSQDIIDMFNEVKDMDIYDDMSYIDLLNNSLELH